MGTLRFFEEVVSFKIRRTFGFADYSFPGYPAVGRTLFCRREVLIKISGIAVKIPDKFLYFCSLNYRG